MKKKEWGNAVWLLFHTLAEKLKDEHKAEINILLTHITNICGNLPCPDCQQHASRVINSVNKVHISASKESLIDFLWSFHNSVNQKTKAAFYPKESLVIYKRANTVNIIKNFIVIMSAASNNQKTMLNSFHRELYIKQFTDYIKNNLYKYNN